MPRKKFTVSVSRTAGDTWRKQRVIGRPVGELKGGYGFVFDIDVDHYMIDLPLTEEELLFIMRKVERLRKDQEPDDGIRSQKQR